MILESLKLTDFQVFQGQHELDLTPRVKHNRTRSIILFGGLNGAGKTTTLTAIRLALYGKQALGLGVSNKAYEKFLSECIHRARNSLVQANSAAIELSFNYSSYGDLKHYTVARGWTVNGKQTKEKLMIFEEGKPLNELNQEQCQGFLNELIPLGVSELFFFDGEKIKELAEDENGLNLGESIKRLLGLDIIDTLRADLGIFVRAKSKEIAGIKTAKKFEELENQLNSLERKIETTFEEINQLRPILAEHSENISKLENNLLAQGGAWASSRESETKKRDELLAEKKLLTKQLHEIIAGSYPLSLGEKFIAKALKQLRDESQARRVIETSSLVRNRVDSLNKSLKSKLNDEKAIKLVREEFKDLLEPKVKTALIHDKSESQLHAIEQVVFDAIENQRKSASAIYQQLTKLEDNLDKLGKNIARAPEESKLKPLIEKLNSLKADETRVLLKKQQLKDDYKRLLREALELSRKLDNLSQMALRSKTENRAISYAQNSRDILKDFSSEMTKQKIADLEKEFSRSFQRLARKEDIHIRASIDPDNFSVKLINDTGEVVDKNRLSAGEKQIYAISILEALATTSGRKLPIIIDTPLGRLDSKHRNKLIKNYFPHASHQVIILSTDTEVDEEFYQELSPSISHAYKLNYDSKAGSTTPIEGYFWKTPLEETA